MQPVQVYSITCCCAGISATEFFHHVFHSTVLTGNWSPWRPKFTSMQCGCKFPWELRWWMQLTNTNEAFVRCLFRISEIKSWSDLIRIRKDTELRLGEDRLDSEGQNDDRRGSASACSLCRRFCKRNSIWWMWNNIWKIGVCTLVHVNYVTWKLRNSSDDPKAGSQCQGLTMTCERWSAPNESFFPPRRLHTCRHFWCLHWI